MIKLRPLCKTLSFCCLIGMCAAANAQTSSVEGWDFQAEYLDHEKNDKHIDNYNLHVYSHIWNNSFLSLYAGGTASVAKGYIDDDKENSDAFGLGPSIMGRLEFNVAGGFYAGLEASGSMRFFTKSHPAGGRAYDFLWRVGPRLSYKASDNMVFGLSAVYAHASNGMNSHNPGYEMKGLSLDLEYKF